MHSALPRFMAPQFLSLIAWAEWAASSGRMGLGSPGAQMGGGGGGGVCSVSAPRPAGAFLGLATCAQQQFPVRSGNGSKGFDLSSIWAGLSSASSATFSTQLKAAVDKGSTGGGSRPAVCVAAEGEGGCALGMAEERRGA